MALITGPVVSVHDVVRRFRRGAETVLALDGVSLELYGGELTVAAGPSGSGKTTLLSILAGIERPDAGRVVTHPPLPEGVPPDRLGWRHLAFVPQALALLDELTVAENVELPARLDPTADDDRADDGRGGAGRPGDPGGPGRPESPANGRDRRDRGWDRAAERERATAELLARLEIEHLADRYPSLTSGGEQQRAAVARALRLRPPLLLGDEPTGHQDRGRIDLLLTVLRQHAYHGAAVLVASHDEEVIAAADRVITLADGRIAADTRSRASSYG
jgi:putative ABC transport system ATP-binding protein